MTGAVHCLGQLNRVSLSEADTCPWCLSGPKDMSHIFGPCKRIVEALRKFSNAVAAFKRGKDGLVTHPCEAVLAFQVALRLLAVDRAKWGRVDTIRAKVIAPLDKYCAAKAKAEQDEKAGRGTKGHRRPPQQVPVNGAQRALRRRRNNTRVFSTAAFPLIQKLFFKLLTPQ